MLESDAVEVLLVWSHSLQNHQEIQCGCHDLSTTLANEKITDVFR